MNQLCSSLWTSRFWYECLISHFLASLGACSLILYVHVTIHVVISWQLSKQCKRWPVSSDRIAGSGIDPLSSSTYPLTSYWGPARVNSNKRYGPWAAPLKFWFRTGLVHENSAGFYMQFTPSSRAVTRWSRSSSNFYALIGQNLTGEFMREMCAASGVCFPELKLTEFCVAN